jgi:hypothetical protein
MTNDPVRTDLLKALAELSELHPEWRLGQMLANLTTAAGHTEEGAIWELDDRDALAAARRLIERRHQQVASKA